MALLPNTNGRRMDERLRNLFLGTLPALLICILLDFVAGGFLGKFFDKIMSSYPLILIILPGLMGLRGNIFGTMASRLTTMLHLGEMEATLRDERISKNIFLSMLLSLIPILILWFIGVLTLGSSGAVEILLIVIVSTIFTTLILGYSTAIAAVIPYRKGIDPDTVAAPLVTSAGDLVTLPFLILFLLIHENSPSTFYILTLIAFATILVLSRKIRRGDYERRIFREVLLILGVLSLISSISGGLLEHYSEIIYASLIFSVLYPPIADTTGNFGSIIGAKTSTRIHLGEIEGFMDRESLLDIFSHFLTAFPIALLMNLMGIFVLNLFTGKSGEIIPLFILSYPFLILLNMIFAYFIAKGFTRIGMDPDNATVPVITTIGDLSSVIFIVLMAEMMV
ncbi:MAG: magnesium transporter [Archaeoglobi archaeon]|nr:magnesium transporter [Candidatus Mnemosynella bozhongmuii]